MSECRAVTESMPLLLTESLDPARRELTHQHIEGCLACSDEWAAYNETWRVMDALPQVEVPGRARERFLETVGIATAAGTEPANTANVVPFRRRPALKWVAQAAAVVVLAGGGYFAGQKAPVRVESERARIVDVTPAPLSIAETRVLNTDSLSPEIEGSPNIANVSFVDADPTDDQIGVEFDVTSHWTVRGNPKDKSMVRLLSYMLENEAAITPRSKTMEWVRQTYSDPANADPEIATALAKVLRNDAHEGVRIAAVETLTQIAPSAGTQTRDALIEALRSDPNPSVRLKAVEALANIARSGSTLDSAAIDMLRQKASQNDENLYVRVKAAEALSNINPVQP